MPELAEVEYYRKKWLPAMGQRVTSVVLNAEKRIFRGQDTEQLIADLPGEPMALAATHGKQMCFRFGDAHWLGIHLGMTGKTSMQSGNYRIEKHDHLVLRLNSGDQLVFTDPRMFGRILYSNTVEAPGWWAKLPPEILSAEFTQEYVDKFLNRRAKAPIKAVLLMQETFPGIGNWMADEILWRSRINPATKCGQIGSKKRGELYEKTIEVTQDALRVIGSDWGTPPDDWLFNHRWKDGGLCPKTGAALHREQIGGRTTCWSPQWQSYRGMS